MDVFEIFDHEKNVVTLKSGSRVLKVIETDTYWSATYDFLLTFHSNYGPILYSFPDKQRFKSKITNFSHLPSILRPPPTEGVPPENCVSALGIKK